MAFFTKKYHPPGTPPGTLVYAREPSETPLRIRLADYNAGSISELADVDAADCKPYLERDSVTWVHVEGHPTEAALQELCRSFKLHALALEDVVNSGQRPKIEEFDDQLFIVMNLPVMQDEKIRIYQVSLFLSESFVVSFSECDFSFFQPIMKRLADSGSRLRSQGPDFLLYSLLDIVIDQGFPVLELFGQQLEELEVTILESVDRSSIEHIHLVKRELILLRRMLWPQREVVNHILHGDYPMVQDATLVYLRDCYDHTIQVMDFLETYRDMASSMLDIYLSSVSNRMNETMRLLTLVATVFIPLTFIVGLYGMNFDRSAGPLNMPELGWPYGYLMVWGLLIAVAALMVAFFRSRRWF